VLQAIPASVNNFVGKNPQSDRKTPKHFVCLVAQMLRLLNGLEVLIKISKILKFGLKIRHPVTNL
jgi:hypothetical protein